MKKAIRDAGVEPGNGYRQMLRDRFLCRVFADPAERFILKGGSGLLARIPDARATRDIDFASTSRESSESALAVLEGLVDKSMGDFLTFKLTKCEESLDENGYSRLLKLRYATFLGQEEKDPILIDLSLDCATTLPPERIEPASRIAVEGIETRSYLAYPLPDQLADKLCAIMELQLGGWPSSRMKDLVDVVFCATNERFKLQELSCAVRVECARRKMAIPERFAAPETWKRGFGAFARKNGLVEHARFEAACKLASDFFNPALANSADSLAWDPESLAWR